MDQQITFRTTTRTTTWAAAREEAMGQARAFFGDHDDARYLTIVRADATQESVTIRAYDDPVGQTSTTVVEVAWEIRAEEQ